MGVLAPRRESNQWDKKTNITINQPIEVEGTVLSAGSYVLRLVDLAAVLYTVRILKAEENRVIKTVFATPTFMFELSDGASSGRTSPTTGSHRRCTLGFTTATGPDSSLRRASGAR